MSTMDDGKGDDAAAVDQRLMMVAFPAASFEQDQRRE